MIKEYKVCLNGTLNTDDNEWEQDGKLTPYIAAMEPGKAQLLFKGPIPKFEYKPNTFDRGLCIAGGSGITRCTSSSPIHLASRMTRRSGR